MDPDQLNETQAHGSAIGGAIGGIIYLAVMVLVIAAAWKMYVKAGEPGWAVIVPFYNLFVLVKIAGKPVLWFILCFIPFVNLVILIILIFNLAKAFGKGAGFAIGMLLLPFIFYPILGFGDAAYVGPKAA